MRSSTAQALIDLNNTFYQTNAASFAQTRQAPWQGWQRVLDQVRMCLNMREADAHAGVDAPRGAQKAHAPLVAIDVAAGNLRFERLLAAELGDTMETIHAVDDCPSLIDEHSLPLHTQVHMRDILAQLMQSKDPLAGLPAGDLVVSFGFMHHVPGRALRERLLDALAAHTAPGGIMALSLWRFMDDERLAAKAVAADTQAEQHDLPTDGLEPGDHFLGWQNSTDTLRYCHHFSSNEIDDIAAHLCKRGLTPCDRFFADGRSGALNAYLICRRDQ